jgi:hypothetical protein
MPLPKPQYPTYVPKSFISPEDRKLSDMALGLYAKYHPGAMQQAHGGAGHGSQEPVAFP